MLKFPALILTPMFSSWTVGPSGTSTACCGRCNGQNNHLKVSFRQTWTNVLITTTGAAIYCFVFLNPRSNYELFGIIFLPIYLLGAVFPLLLLQFLDKCKKCCCTCCMPCFPVLNVTTLDVDEEFAKPTTQPGFELKDLFTLPQVTGVLDSH